MDRPIRKEGELLKWTNYLIGWQPRWFVLDGNVLSYCISEAEVSHGCKGSVNLSDCEVNADSYDHCRFEIVVPGEQCFYIRARTTKERQEWLIALGTAKSQSSRASCIFPSTSSTCEDVLSHRKLVVQQIIALRDTLLKQAVEAKDKAFLSACNDFLKAMDALPPDKASVDVQESVLTNGTSLLADSIQCNAIESGAQSGDQQPFSSADLSRQPNLVEEFGQRMKEAMLTKGPDAFSAFMSSLTLIIDILNVIDLMAMNVIKLEVADCMQIFRTAKKHSAKEVSSLDDMLVAELKIPPANVIKDSVQRVRSVVVFLQTFFDELRAPEADPSSCAMTAYAKSVKDHQSIVLQYVFSESVHAVNNRKFIATNLIHKGQDNKHSNFPAKAEPLFDACYITLTQCVLWLDAILARNSAF
ncbi:PH and GLTP domain containing protein [Trichuris trichiura]|uniref:Pleckstrin homology domain-containing family A member 8 n=1 Tax=Trichuris trichiura TaxID=36087 RepID=A0A077Z7N2_TRITR|nr:PH and GLTP domain containing protein [Trichuris trichiura]